MVSMADKAPHAHELGPRHKDAQDSPGRPEDGAGFRLAMPRAK